MGYLVEATCRLACPESRCECEHGTMFGIYQDPSRRPSHDLWIQSLRRGEGKNGRKRQLAGLNELSMAEVCTEQRLHEVTPTIIRTVAEKGPTSKMQSDKRRESVVGHTKCIWTTRAPGPPGPRASSNFRNSAISVRTQSGSTQYTVAGMVCTLCTYSSSNDGPTMTMVLSCW